MQKAKSLLIYHLLFSFIGVVISLSGLGQTDLSKLDRYLDTLSVHDKFMGSIVLTKDGKLIYQRTLGFSDIESKKKADAGTRYRIGSITKTFTSVLVMKAVEAGRLTLDQTIDKWYPTVRNSDRITIRHLLSHRSGIHNFTDDPGYLDWNTNYRTEQQLLDTIIAQRSDFMPGVRFSYSNSGYLLLTFILQKVWGRPYEKILRKQVLQPAGLRNTYYGKQKVISDHGSYSYRFQFPGIWKREKMTDLSIPAGAGGILSTAADVARFADRLFSGKLVSAASLEEMKKMKDNYGLGMMRFPFYGKWSFGHTGGIDAYQSVYSHYESEGISYVLLSNGTAVVANEISIAALSAVFGKPFTIPNYNTVVLEERELEPYLGTYSSKQISLKITFTKKGNRLVSKATGQQAFELDAMGDHRFTFDRAGIQVEFNPDLKQMVLKQGGGSYLFVKE